MPFLKFCFVNILFTFLSSFLSSSYCDFSQKSTTSAFNFSLTEQLWRCCGCILTASKVTFYSYKVLVSMNKRIFCWIVIVIFLFTVYMIHVDARRVIRPTGPSGKPVQHFKQYPSRKRAQNAAQNAGRGNPPIRHTAHKPGQSPHFHPSNRNGNIRKDGSHYGYPKRQGWY